MIQVTSAKGVKLGYIHQFQRFTLVLWKSGETMTFSGPASVLFGSTVVPVDANGVHTPKSMVKAVKNAVEVLTSHFRQAIGVLSDCEYDGVRYAIADTLKSDLTCGSALLYWSRDEFSEGYFKFCKAMNFC